MTQYNEYENLIGLPDPTFSRNDALEALSVCAIPNAGLRDGGSNGVWDVLVGGDTLIEAVPALCADWAARIERAGFKVLSFGLIQNFRASHGVRFTSAITEQQIQRGDLFRLEVLSMWTTSEPGDALERLAFERQISGSMRDGWNVYATHYAESQSNEGISQTFTVALIKAAQS